MSTCIPVGNVYMCTVCRIMIVCNLHILCHGTPAFHMAQYAAIGHLKWVGISLCVYNVHIKMSCAWERYEEDVCGKGKQTFLNVLSFHQ